jgi:anionic cell wall polymer biosynthesis LytR-Cps2A-Psr (LCP) family protein
MTRLLLVCGLLIALISGCGFNGSSDDPAALKGPKDSLAEPHHGNDKGGKLNADGIDTTAFSISDSTITLRRSAFPEPGGRVVNVMVTGVDSRLGDYTMHADANHVLRFFVDSGVVEIISIPRDTEGDAGFDDTTNLNRLTNVRANRGRTTYHKEVCRIAGIQRIDHWVEFGFSQALGLLELLGYDEQATTTLRILRTRQAYRTGDFQRSYNQGQFIRQVLLKTFDNFDGMTGDLALRVALSFVDTDMDHETCRALIDAMRAKNFPNDPSNIWVRLKPDVYSKFQVLDFSKESVKDINQAIDSRVKQLGLDTMKATTATYEQRLQSLIEKAAADSARSPGSVVRLLRRPYEQHAWMQVVDKSKRAAMRDRICTMLAVSYRRMKQPAKAEEVERRVALERSMR